MASLERTLLRTLEKSKGEREIHAFLKKHPDWLTWAFCSGDNFRMCIPEFKLGNEFRCDFLILSANSTRWFATFVELEPIQTRLYLKNGTESAVLRVAKRQLMDWEDWVRRNEAYLRESFAKIFRRRRTHSRCSRVDIHSKAETEILDSGIMISFRYCIVIGRRDSLSPEEQRRRAMEYRSSRWSGQEIATYDRFVDIARRCDEYEREISRRVAERGSELSKARKASASRVA